MSAAIVQLLGQTLLGGGRGRELFMHTAQHTNKKRSVSANGEMQDLALQVTPPWRPTFFIVVAFGLQVIYRHLGLTKYPAALTPFRCRHVCYSAAETCRHAPVLT